MTDYGASSYHRYLQGDQGALEELVKEYGDKLVRFSYCILGDPYAAEDVMEDTFATLIVKRKKFEENAKFSTYLFQIARNRCMDLLRKRKKLYSLPLDDLGRLPHGSDPEEEAIGAEEKTALYKTLCARNKKQIYTLLSRAKACLKELLQKEECSGKT